MKSESVKKRNVDLNDLACARRVTIFEQFGQVFSSKVVAAAALSNQRKQILLLYHKLQF